MIINEIFESKTKLVDKNEFVIDDAVERSLRGRTSWREWTM